jgi:hypothetical protein
MSLQQFKEIDYTVYEIDNALLDNTGAFTTVPVINVHKVLIIAQAPKYCSWCQPKRIQS